MFGASDEDDFEFIPSAGSKLASLFNLETTPSKGNSSLTYTAPKQPKSQPSYDDGPQSHGSPISNKLSLILVKEIHAFKLENGNYNAHGKSGAALVGNDTSRIFRLLLYKGKQQIFTSATIGPTFKYTVLPNLYASFYDSGMQNWSINFDSKENLMEFAKQVGVARYKAFKPNEETPLCQELYPGSGMELKEGDFANLSLIASVIPKDSLKTGKAEMTASFEQQLSEVGWTAGLIGASPGSHRLLLYPESVEIPWISTKKSGPILVEAFIQGGVANPNKASSVHFSSNEHKKPVQVLSGGDSAADSGGEDSSVRARGASIKEALTQSPRSNKASIISRMARMGQAMLPLEGATVCKPSDSEETEEELQAQEVKRPPLKSRPNKLRSGTTSTRQHLPSPATSNSNIASHVSSVSTSITPTMTIVQAQSLHRPGPDGSVVQYLASEGQLVSLNAPNSNLSSPDPAPHISMFLSESRMHNTEMRMHLNKFGDKMDQLMTKVDSLQQQPSRASPAVPGMEPNALLSSIEKLVHDNQALQAEVAEKNKRLDEQNERIFALLSANSKFLEQSTSFYEQKQQHRQDSLQHQELSVLVQHLQTEKDILSDKVTSLQTQLANVQGLVQSLQKCNNDLTQELERSRSQFPEDVEAESKQTGSKSSLQEEINILTSTLQEQKQLVSDLQQKIEVDKENYTTELNTYLERYKLMEEQNMEKISSLNCQLKEEQSNSSRLATSVIKLEVQCVELMKKLKDSKDLTTAPFSNFAPEVKSLMNTLYRALSQKFVPEQSYDGGLVKSLIASTIKQETLNFVEQLETHHSGPNTDQVTRSKPQGADDQDPVVKSAGKEKAKENETGTEDSSFLHKSPLDSSSASAVSTSTEPDLPPIPGTVLSSTSAGHASLQQEEREPSPVGSWGQHPPPLPLFNDEDEDSDDWVP